MCTSGKRVNLSDIEKRLPEIALRAWESRKRARLIGTTGAGTKVGCAVLSTEGNVWGGCNVEHSYRSHDVHAEVNALSSLIAQGDSGAVAVLVVAERTKFTPCGSCMDWIFEIGGATCWVGFQPAISAHPVWYQAADLMPHYPS
jgi:cytidine deaminase